MNCNGEWHHVPILHLSNSCCGRPRLEFSAVSRSFPLPRTPDTSQWRLLLPCRHLRYASQVSRQDDGLDHRWSSRRCFSMDDYDAPGQNLQTRDDHSFFTLCGSESGPSPLATRSGRTARRRQDRGHTVLSCPRLMLLSCAVLVGSLEGCGGGHNTSDPAMVTRVTYYAQTPQ
jgi:hypothetical protein